MMDYYSQFPAPDYDQCKKEVITALCQNGYRKPEDSEELNTLLTEAFIDSNVLENSSSDIPKVKYSFTGWCVFGKKDVITSFTKITERKRKEKLKRKIRGLLRTSYLLIKAHKQTMEKLYHPDSVFVNTVLKSDFKCSANSLPLPPNQTD